MSSDKGSVFPVLFLPVFLESEIGNKLNYSHGGQFACRLFKLLNLYKQFCGNSPPPPKSKEDRKHYATVDGYKVPPGSTFHLQQALLCQSHLACCLCESDLPLEEWDGPVPFLFKVPFHAPCWEVTQFQEYPQLPHVLCEGIVSVPIVYKAFCFTLGWLPHGALQGGGLLSSGREKDATMQATAYKKAPRVCKMTGTEMHSQVPNYCYKTGY